MMAKFGRVLYPRINETNLLVNTFIYFIVGCSPNHKKKKTELNKILHVVFKYESNHNPSKENIHLVNPKLLQLKIYTQAQKEILWEKSHLHQF